ncbi:hypothetical protein E4U43_001235 [Claviceps pusilla]|uniref:Protein kinase domain-containing protein n=1 Tax=Claviceps pusilla TaxID=123648 RepID=A0A9P7NAI4_9HYPO|nr:hypothetical protein E4U43_001235 [Claviceps pusilla]
MSANDRTSSSNCPSADVAREHARQFHDLNDLETKRGVVIAASHGRPEWQHASRLGASATRRDFVLRPAPPPVRNSAVDELVDAFRRVSADAPPGTRIIIAKPPQQHADQLVDPSASAVPLPHTLWGRETAGVRQRMTDADFLISISFDDPCPNPSLRMTRSRIECRVCYDPQSDYCQVLNEGYTTICIMKLSPQDGLEEDSNRLSNGQCCWISTGLWRICTVGDERHQHVVDFLLLQRRFVVSEIPFTDKPSFPQGPMSRGPFTQGPLPPPFPTQRNTAGEIEMQFVLAPHVANAANSATDAAHLTSEHSSSLHFGPSGNMCVLQLSRQNSLAIQDVDCAEIVQEENGMVSSYTLGFQYLIDEMHGSKVIACCHSALHDNVVAKALDYTKDATGGPSLWRCVGYWKEEYQLLSRLDHPNIVKMKSFDARLLVLYLEHLPLSLHRQMPVPPAVARAVLLDISAALKYLTEQGVLHNDVKPSNIAYSAERGGVLFDFGMATPEGSHQHFGGTWMHYSPEYVLETTVRKRRGPFSDVWALAITLLLCIGKMKYPDRQEKLLCVNNITIKGTHDHQKFMNWLQRVSCARDSLNLQDDMEMLIYRMLDHNVASRITAAQIVAELAG